MIVIAQLVKKFTVFYGIRKYITVKISFYWDITPCSPSKVTDVSDEHVFSAYYLLHAGF
jgi:hypothetical protein